MIFRKVSDLRREKELAERRKNDPALNQSQDHIVRKLFSKFKKTPTSCDMSALVPFKDAERGEVIPSPAISRNNSVSRLSPPKVPEPTNHTSNGNCLLNVNKSTNKVNSELTAVKETPDKRLSMVMCNGPKKKIGGWGRLKAKTTPDPPSEEVPINRPELVPSENSKLQATDNPMERDENDPEKTEHKANSFIIPTLSLSSDNETITNFQPQQSSAIPKTTPPIQTPEYTQMMVNLTEFKVYNFVELL